MMIKIAHLYPDMLNLYGDRGNIIALTKRMELRGISTQVDRITMGKSFNADDYDILFIGGGQDFEQDVLLEDLKRARIRKLNVLLIRARLCLLSAAATKCSANIIKLMTAKCLNISALLILYRGQRGTYDRQFCL